VNGKTITYTAADVRVKQLIQDTAMQITPKPRLELIGGLSGVNPCTNPADGGSTKRIVVGQSYWLRGIPKDQLEAVATQVKDYWQGQRFLIEGTTGFGQGQPTIFARSYPDNFVLSLDWSANDVLILGAASECIWPEGTPQPGS
jgi:hypothetical protein